MDLQKLDGTEELEKALAKTYYKKSGLDDEATMPFLYLW